MKRYALLAGFVGAVTCGAEAVTYAKLSGETFKFYTNEACTQTNASKTAVDSDTIVFFASNAEFQDLVPYTNVIAKARAKVALQNDVKLTTNVVWRAFDFNINGKTVTLDGWDCRVGCVQGTGTFAAGNLVTNGDFETNPNQNGWNKNPYGWTRNEKGRCCVLNSGVQLLHKSNMSYWAVLYTPQASLTETPFFQQTIAVSRSNWEYFVSFRYMTSAYTEKRVAEGYIPYLKGKYMDKDNTEELVKEITDNAKIKVYLNDVLLESIECTTTNIQTFATTRKDAKALSAGDWPLKFTIANPNHGACFDDVVVSPLSRLFFDIPEGTYYDAGNLTLKDAGLQVRKVGKGTIVFSKTNNTWRVEGSQSLVVSDGIARQAAKNACGAQYAKISVSSGAQFDLNGRTSWDYDYILNGSGPGGSGALTSTKQESKTYQPSNSGFLRNIELKADSTLYVNQDRNWGTIFYGHKNDSNEYDGYLSATNTMNGHKLTIDATPFLSGDVGGRLFLGNMTFFGEGTIEVTSNACIQAMYNDISAAECDVDIYGMFWSQNFNSFSEVKSLKFHEGACFRNLKSDGDRTTVVYDTYAPNSSFGPRHAPAKWSENVFRHPVVQLGDAEHLDVTLDLSEWDGTFDDSAQGTLTFYDVRGESEGSTGKMKVVVDIGERTKRIAGSRSAIYKWKDDPRAYVEFVAAPSWASKNVKMSVKSDGIYGFSGAAIILR